MPHQIAVTDEEIHFTERILLPESSSFDDERIRFIKNFLTVDLQACPGSGKTTCLLAKLIILAKYLSHNDEIGVLVLSHTNAAVDEIKSKIAKHCPNLFSHPNFIGTIQGFVDQFLAIPFYAQKYNHLPYRIDNEIFSENINKIVNLPNYSSLNFWLERRGNKYELLENLSFGTDGNLKTSCVLPGPTTPTYRSLLEIKNKLISDGYLSFEDAYYLSERYILEFPKIIDLINKRFSFVYIDEMQDTDEKQLNILDKLFPIDCRSVVQRIGDQNQAIYNHKVKSENIWTPRSNFLTLDGSKRLSESIATAIKNISLYPQSLTGNSQRTNIKPKLILFDDQTIKDVPKKFCEIITENNLHQRPNSTFKAIGWRKKSTTSTDLTIGSYFEADQFSAQTVKIDYNYLKNYIAKSSFTINIDCLGLIRKRIIDAITKAVRIAGIKRGDGYYFSSQSIIFFLRQEHSEEYETLKSNLYKWTIAIYDGEDLSQEISEYIVLFLNRVFSHTETTQELSNFFNLEGSTPQLAQPFRLSPINIYNYHSGEVNLNIEIATIHSVKGETHTGTLYLETYYNKGYESGRLIGQLKGERINNCKILVKESLKMAYVGMSRPTDLLCFAASKARIPKAEIINLRNNWDIVIL